MHKHLSVGLLLLLVITSVSGSGTGPLATVGSDVTARFSEGTGGPLLRTQEGETFQLQAVWHPEAVSGASEPPQDLLRSVLSSEIGPNEADIPCDDRQPAGRGSRQVSDNDGAAGTPAGENTAEDRPLFSRHVVVSGETLWEIAREHGVDVETLIGANPNISDPTRVKPGTTLLVPTKKGALHYVAPGESLWEIARTYGTNMEAIVRANDISDPSRLSVDQVLFIPGAAYSLDYRRLVSPEGRLLPHFWWPVSGRISSRYGMRWGRMHHGIDIAVPVGTEVRAAAAGRIVYSGWSGGYGKLVIVDHGYGIQTRYGHNSRLLWSAGKRVSRGQVIALSGNTGNSTGPHVHFEIRYRGRTVDPLKYLQ